jgi:hypothetical protein
MKHRFSLDRVEWEMPMQTDDPESPPGQKTPWTLGDRLMATKGPASLGFAPRPARAKVQLAFDELAASDEGAFDPVEQSRDATPPLAPPAAGDEPELSDILNRLAALSEPESADGAQATLPTATAIHPPVAASGTSPARRSTADRAIRVANLCLLGLSLVLSLSLFYQNAPADMRAGWVQRLSVLQSTVTDMIARRDEALRGAASADVPPRAPEIAPPQHELEADATAAPAVPTPTESSKAVPIDTAAATDEPAGTAPVGPVAAAVGTATAPTGNTAIAPSLAEARLPQPAAADTQIPQFATPVATAKPPGPVAVIVSEAKPAQTIAAEVPTAVAATALAPNAASDKLSAETMRAGPQVDVAEIAALIKRGDDLLGTRDIGGARLFYERAGAAGSARGAISAGKTYDPVYLAEINVRGIRPDPAKAIEWYGKALAQGETSAQAMIARLR